ncbi:unnamed protein product [Nippostrongylus brasiliensis]|uniref:Uncharacterized protein n=1 Tax=Nippostrongylus brasiliensis TaxID=27835 RepID=A0A0N4YX42_NIPBR|nr:unnamed protein product [Nippostrongylus brasiliensis]VDL86141.1 unnamed protein product [Nippostrongylus brasiliensis]
MASSCGAGRLRHRRRPTSHLLTSTSRVVSVESCHLLVARVREARGSSHICSIFYLLQHTDIGRLHSNKSNASMLTVSWCCTYTDNPRRMRALSVDDLQLSRATKDTLQDPG